MKPILFNTEMVRAILEGRKTVTRRVVKGQEPDWEFVSLENDRYITKIDRNGKEYPSQETGLCATFEWGSEFPLVKAPYRPGDILYVRETWAELETVHGVPYWTYKADDHILHHSSGENFEKWRPSIHMPREAARLFLRVTGVRVERLQDITDAEAQKEGAADREDLRRIWNNCYSKPRPVKDKHGVIDHYESYPWEDVMETRTFRGKPWHVIGNPWVWVIEFERVSREEAENA